MDSQSYEYWLSQGNYLPTHQTAIFDMPPDLSNVPSLSGSPVSSNFDQMLAPVHVSYQPHYPYITEEMNFNCQLPMTPSDFGSADESPYCSPQPRQTELAYPIHKPSSQERTHATSGRRRAQNRAAQRAFRERKEKHARDLETQLNAMTEKYRTLEWSHHELNAAYDKLRKTIELLTKVDGEEQPPSNADTMRKILEILHGEVQSVAKLEDFELRA